MGRIEQLERRAELERAREKSGEDLARARGRAEPLSAERAEARAASRRFNEARAEVYRDPAAARRAFHARSRRHGVAAAAADIARHPERFGDLRGVQFGTVRSAERREAFRNAGRLEHLGAEHLSTSRLAWTNREEYREARANDVALERTVGQLDSELARSVGSAQLQHRLGRELRSLHPAERHAFRRSLPIPQRRMLTAAMWAGQAFAREQGHER